MINIVLASSNAGKLRELNSTLEARGIQFTPQSQLNVEDAIEDGLSFVENALIKARHAARATGLPALADDSGLAVNALGGAPGIYSARYSGQRDDQANYLKLIRDLDGHANRDAQFICCLVLVRHWQDPMPVICQGRWQGTIAHKAMGDGGFGYDPVFIPEGMTTSAATLTKEQKSTISHRGLALRQLDAFLDQNPSWLAPL